MHPGGEKHTQQVALHRQQNTPEKRDAPGHVEPVVGLVPAGLDALHLLLGEGRQGDGLDPVGELAVDAAAGRAHEGVEVRDDVLRQLSTRQRDTQAHARTCSPATTNDGRGHTGREKRNGCGRSISDKRCVRLPADTIFVIGWGADFRHRGLCNIGVFFLAAVLNETNRDRDERRGTICGEPSAASHRVRPPLWLWTGDAKVWRVSQEPPPGNE